MASNITVRQNGNIAEVLLNRPEAYNAFNHDLITEFADNMVALATDTAIRGVVISGEGKAFSGGGDLRWATSYPGGRVSAAFHTLASRFHLAILEIRHMKKPVIAAINGVAAGGGFSLALACDFRVMNRSATLRQAYTSSGLSIDGGGTFSLPRLVGLARALEIAAFDEPISAEQALAWGLVTKVVEDGQALAEAVKMAQRLAATSLSSFAASKQLLNASFDTPLETQLEHEREALAAAAAMPDGIEGLKAFVEKRKPSFG